MPFFVIKKKKKKIGKKRARVKKEVLSLLAPTIFNIEYITYIYITLNLASKIDQRKENRWTSDYQSEFPNQISNNSGIIIGDWFLTSYDLRGSIDHFTIAFKCRNSKYIATCYSKPAARRFLFDIRRCSEFVDVSETVFSVVILYSTFSRQFTVTHIVRIHEKDFSFVSRRRKIENKWVSQNLEKRTRQHVNGCLVWYN